MRILVYFPLLLVSAIWAQCRPAGETHIERQLEHDLVPVCVEPESGKSIEYLYELVTEEQLSSPSGLAEYISEPRQDLETPNGPAERIWVLTSESKLYDALLDPGSDEFPEWYPLQRSPEPIRTDAEIAYVFDFGEDVFVQMRNANREVAWFTLKGTNFFEEPVAGTSANWISLHFSSIVWSPSRHPDCKTDTRRHLRFHVADLEGVGVLPFLAFLDRRFPIPLSLNVELYNAKGSALLGNPPRLPNLELIDCARRLRQLMVGLTYVPGYSVHYTRDRDDRGIYRRISRIRNGKADEPRQNLELRSGSLVAVD